MRTVILLALVAIAAAVPSQYSFEAVPIPYEKPSSGEYSWLDRYFGKSNTFQVPQYIAYQFHHFQQLRYTPAQVSEFFLQHGYPAYVVQYLTRQYEAGLNKPYFEAPYLMYQYYFEQTIPQEVQEYIHQQIYNYFQQFQKFFATYGLPKVFEQYYSVPIPFQRYMSHQLRFYTQNGLNFEQAQFAYQDLETAFQYTQNIMQFFVNGTISKNTHAYMYENLQNAYVYLQQAHQIYQPYLMHEQFVPYYVFQYYVQHIQQAFFYFQNVYQYIQKEHVAVPESFVYQIKAAFFAIQKVHQMYESVNWFDFYYRPSGIDSSYFGGKQWSYDYDYHYPTISQEPQYNWFGKYMNKDSYYDDQKYGYLYGSFDKYHNNYQYVPYKSLYNPYETSQYNRGFEPSHQFFYGQYGDTRGY